MARKDHKKCDCGAPSIRQRGVWLGVCWDCRDAQLTHNGCTRYVSDRGKRMDKAFTDRPKEGGGMAYARDGDAEKKAERALEAKKRKNSRAKARRKAEREGRMPKKGQDDIPQCSVPKGKPYPEHGVRRMRKERTDRLPDLDD